MSHLGCRLMVASSANTSRPLAPGACGDIARAFSTKAAISSAAEGFTSVTVPALPDADGARSAEFGLVGSPDMEARGARVRWRYARRSPALGQSVQAPR